MSNKEIYKNAMSGVRHSDDTIERIFDMTVDKKKPNSKQLFKRIASATLALALLVGGFGANVIVQNSKANQPLGVMVAYADEFLRIKSGTKQTVCKSLYFAPADDEEKCREQRANADTDYEENREVFDKLGKINETASMHGVGVFDIADKNGNTTTMLYTTGAGFFVVNRTDYKNVKLFTVENESEDGYLQFEWSGTKDLLEAITEENVNEENPYECFINHKFTLTGEQLIESQKNYNEYGYSCEWIATPEVFERYDGKYGKNFDASSIKDIITFTFEYNDGTTESVSVNISFDDYGHMQLS